MKMYNSKYNKASYNKSNLNNGLVGWWMNLPFYSESKTWYDLTGNNNCTKTGDSTISNRSPMRRGGIASFYTGSNNSGYTQTTTKYKIPTGSAARTLSAWFYPTTLDGNARGIVKLGSNGGGAEFVVYWISSGGNTHVFTDGVNGDNNKAMVGLRATNVWHHILFSMTTGGVFTCFFNGVQEFTGTFSTGINTDTQKVEIGYRSSSLNGYIDDVRIWNRALSAEEARGVYFDSLTGYKQTLFNDNNFSAYSAGGGGLILPGMFPFMMGGGF